MRYLGMLFFAVFLLCVGRNALAFDRELVEGRMRACGSASEATNANKYMECATAYEHWYYNVRPGELARQAEQERRARQQQMEMQYNVQHERERREAERQRQIALEDRRVRALEEAAQAQRDATQAQFEQAEAQRRQAEALRRQAEAQRRQAAEASQQRCGTVFNSRFGVMWQCSN